MMQMVPTDGAIFADADWPCWRVDVVMRVKGFFNGLYD